VSLAYPSAVSLPGSGALPVNDPTDPTTREVLLDLNLYNGFVFFFDNDTALVTTVAAPISLASPYPFERARFDCVNGAQIAPDAFSCSVVDESDSLGGVIPANQFPGCELTVTPVP
jgi:hypothetical protein